MKVCTLVVILSLWRAMAVLVLRVHRIEAARALARAERACLQSAGQETRDSDAAMGTGRQVLSRYFFSGRSQHWRRL